MSSDVASSADGGGRSAGARPAAAGGRAPRPSLTPADGAVMIVGIVLGVGIFRSPPVVAVNSGDGLVFLALWLVGGFITLVGALCYAELSAAYPDAGGEYHFVSRAFGPPVGFLFAWSRMSVIQTGSIAILGFVFGDYAADLLVLGPGASPLLAGAVVVVLTAVNVAGIRPGRWTQYVLTGGSVLGLLAVTAAGLVLAPGADASPVAGAGGGGASAGSSLGLALIFVLLAFGGWSEGAYLSAEVRGGRRGIGKALFWGTAAVTAIYVLANAAYLRGLGLGGVAGTDAVATDLLRAAAGPRAAAGVSVLVMLTALSSANVTVITGARSNYALGRDFPQFRFLDDWREERGTPVRALLLQGGIALVLVGFGALARGGFEAMVAYTAPVFWLILLLTGAAVIVLRRRDPHTERPFRVPLYPVTPLLFCAASAYMLWSAVRNAGDGALLGLAVMAAGLPLLFLSGGGESENSGDGFTDATIHREDPR